MDKYIKINPADNIIVAVEIIPAGSTIEIDGKSLQVSRAIPAGHKVAVQDFEPGDNIIKYGFPIGHATQAIPAGGWVNERNIKTNLSGLLDYTYDP